jgi:hypothetical protein
LNGTIQTADRDLASRTTPVFGPARTAPGWLFLPIALVAAVARLYALGRIPYGIWYDEAANGVEGIASALAGRFPVFYPANFGREGLYINLVGWSERALGVTPFALRLPAALAGIATVFFIYLLADVLYSRRVALLAAWFTATGFWAVLMSRISFRAVLAPLFLTAALYFITAAARHRAGWAWAVAGGVACGLGFHSYPTFRVAALLLVVVCVAELRAGAARGAVARRWLVFAAAALITALPILVYFTLHPGEALSRSGMLVWNFEHPWLRVLYGIGVATRMFVLESDVNWRHNLRGAPELAWPVAIFFVAGAVATFWRLRSGRERWQWLPWAWLCIGLIPCAITFDIPHAVRAGVVMPAAFLLCALGADALLNAVSRRRLAALAVMVLVVASGAGELARYFGEYATAVAATEAFVRRDAAIARELNAQPMTTKRYVIVPRDPFFRYPIDFGVYGHPAPEYVFSDDLFRATDLSGRFAAGSIIASVSPDARTFRGLQQRGARIRVLARGEIAIAVAE